MADSHSFVARWRNYFSQLFNVHGVKDVGQAEIHTVEPLAPETSASEFELVIDKLKSHKSPGIDQIPAELIKAGIGTICLEIHKLITSINLNVAPCIFCRITSSVLKCFKSVLCEIICAFVR